MEMLERELPPHWVLNSSLSAVVYIFVAPRFNCKLSVIIIIEIGIFQSTQYVLSQLLHVEFVLTGSAEHTTH